jgi:hypothetical protein
VHMRIALLKLAHDETCVPGDGGKTEDDEKGPRKWSEGGAALPGIVNIFLTGQCRELLRQMGAIGYPARCFRRPSLDK